MQLGAGSRGLGRFLLTRRSPRTTQSGRGAKPSAGSVMSTPSTGSGSRSFRGAPSGSVALSTPATSMRSVTRTARGLETVRPFPRVEAARGSPGEVVRPNRPAMAWARWDARRDRGSATGLEVRTRSHSRVRLQHVGRAEPDEPRDSVGAVSPSRVTLARASPEARLGLAPRTNRGRGPGKSGSSARVKEHSS
jgi:hypothetical protein